MSLSLKRVEVPAELGLRLCEGCTLEQWMGFDVVWTQGRRGKKRDVAAQGEVLCDPVRSAGFDTIQLFAAFGGQRFEIIDCRLGLYNSRPAVASRPALQRLPPPPPPPWTSACAPPETSTYLRRPASNGRWRPCNCSAETTFLNCGTCATPMSVLRLPQPNHDAFEIHPPRA